MTILAMMIAGILAALVFAQAGCTVFFVRLFYRDRAAPIPDADLPNVSILLSLRGADPNLAKGLRRLMAQDYPRYELRIVVDREGDPSWDVAQEAVEATGFQQVHVRSLRERPKTCSLKCAALVQMASELDDACDVVVLADADLVSHAGWLRELVTPLTEPGVGATFGNRWFWPHNAYWGSLVRYLWNVAAVVPMYVWGIPWGGTFAMRWSLLRDTGLLEKWSKAVVEDAPIRGALEDQQLRLRFVPDLMMVNREDCDLRFSLDFIKRQLTWTRVYLPRWWLISGHAAVTTIVMLAALLLVPVGLITGQYATTWWVLAGIVGYLGVMVFQLILLERAVRLVVGRRGEPVTVFSHWVKLKMLPAIPLTQVVYNIAVLLATFRRRVAWRGVTYHLRGPWDIQMVEYQPYEQSAQPADSNRSL